ncbi:Peptidoglycan/xylan/chitin deacetylase, PgdA/CDA1 family [Streptomyces sp. 1222.5]|uniref:polysaccharide deacetylase family protein n=1 Tax=unclassified Streptomyces TaxID=2593676 RepID=UPI00089AFEA2|nr:MULTISPECIES: polysaccharide deacetylase family protein [unclassified Streptomyces]PKW11464.1 peptidoglycan/xylan/chitin deacetylase (PgdA/CDA1 family) [Streptomyces sp. 5112.2]SEB78320.1 Peptidoglycan/xylan/chitin deacetylase, PgdA/CDA1 family [Streptomyces sp. 1222.5]SEE12191.1 Peptidoglycan/xylan/chitin deacetylase, PgdA/CDA1 family [Streptomyces sp. 2231.1]
MQKDHLFTRRRMLLAGGAAAGAAGTAGVVLAGGGEETAGTAAPAGGPQARQALKPSAFRLQPLTGYGPPHAAPRKLKVRKEPILQISGRGRRMVLTFDDGPNPAYTPHILDTLAKYDVRAMFFVCGECVVDNRELLVRMADEGHVVGNHTWTHPLLTTMNRKEIRSEMERTSDVIEDTYGDRPQWFRAPYGAWNRAAFQLGAEMGMEPMAWTVDTTDWEVPGTDTIIDRVEGGAAPGVVVLSHDAGGDRSQTVRAIREWLPYLIDSGYHLTVPSRRPT